ncbi:MAG: ATP-binding cassette domain-containing protein, partial [Coriobacteriales bacterium]|nr:ATP-binding cassette domain-containing protein [Coriobacteriales bacterium]
MILSVNNLSKSFGVRTLFDGVTFRLNERDRIALVGPNGAGKTTLLNIIASHDSPDSGTITLAKDAAIGYLLQHTIEPGSGKLLDNVLSAAQHLLDLQTRLTHLEEQISLLGAELADAESADAELADVESADAESADAGSADAEENPKAVGNPPQLDSMAVNSTQLVDSTAINSTMAVNSTQLCDSTAVGTTLDKLLAEYGRLTGIFELGGGYTIESEARSVLFGLGFKESDLTRETDEFSGGWKMRIALARLLLSRPDLLLLDEPTNHLDLETVRWLEGFLRSYEGAIILVSHDRAFMDGMVDGIIELDAGHATTYHGGYSDDERQRAENLRRLQEAYEQQQTEIAHLQAFVDRFRYKAKKARQAQDRLKKLERIERIILPEARKQVHFRFRQPVRTGDLVIELTGIHKAYG